MDLAPQWQSHKALHLIKKQIKRPIKKVNSDHMKQRKKLCKREDRKIQTAYIKVERNEENDKNTKQLDNTKKIRRM